MSEARDTIKEILASRDQARDAIYKAERALDTQREKIKDNAYNRDLTTDEIDKIGKINATIGSLGAAEDELVIVTVQSLNQSREAKRLASVAAAMNKDLAKRKTEIQGVAKTIKQIGAVIKAIDAVVAGALKLATLFA